MPYTSHIGEGHHPPTRPLLSDLVANFPTAAGTIYFPRSSRLLVEDKLNLARCAAMRSTVYVLDNDRWTREYRCAQSWTAKVFSLN